MIDIYKRYRCDSCGEEEFVSESENIPGWTISTEVGDLCPECYNAWELHKKKFVEKMREKFFH